MIAAASRRIPSVAVVIGATLTAAACGHSSGTSTPGSDVQHVSIDGNDMMRFVPSRVVVHPGTVVITLHDVGQEAHNIDFPALHVKSPLISAGQSTSITLHVKAGHTYTFDCDIHVTEGMIGTLVVSNPDTAPTSGSQ